jgi:hypothetical protein
MRSSQTTTAQQTCENILTEGKRYNIEHGILPSENAVADRLLRRSIELREAYEELFKKLHAHPPALKVFLDLLLSTAAFWSPEKMGQARVARDELADVNHQIMQNAEKLAELLKRRSQLHNTSGFSSDTHYHVCDVIKAASSGNHLFNFYVKERLDDIRDQFDLKYWPSLEQFLQVLVLDAREASMGASDPLTAAATSALRPSQADFFKAIMAAIKGNAHEHGQLPRGFKLTDNTLASLANCALDLGPDKLADGDYVKRLRQRQRSGGR